MRLKQFLNEKSDAYQYMNDLLWEKHNKVKIPKIDKYTAYMQDDGWMAWEDYSAMDTRILTMPFKKDQQSMSIKIVTDYGDNEKQFTIPFSITWDEDRDFNKYLKVIKEIIRKFG